MPRRKLNGLWIILEGEEDDVPNLTQEEDWGDNVPDLEQEDTFNNVIKEGNSPNVFLCDQCEFATSKEYYLHFCIRSRRSTVLETLFVTFVVRCSLH